MRFFVITCRKVLNVWPETTLLLPVWPRDATGSDPPDMGDLPCPKNLSAFSDTWCHYSARDLWLRKKHSKTGGLKLQQVVPALLSFGFPTHLSFGPSPTETVHLHSVRGQRGSPAGNRQTRAAHGSEPRLAGCSKLSQGHGGLRCLSACASAPAAGLQGPGS